LRNAHGLGDSPGFAVLVYPAMLRHADLQRNPTPLINQVVAKR
jgi:hypothetical protein